MSFKPRSTNETQLSKDCVFHRTIGWVIGFSTFLIGCIDYPRLWHSHHLSEVVIPQCTSR